MPDLGEHEHIVTAWCENYSGPGWANSLVNVVIRDGNGKLREDAFQPDEFPSGLMKFFDAAVVSQFEIRRG